MARRRELAAIVFTDIEGFTRLAQLDERGALALAREQERLARSVLRGGTGRLVKTMGDGLLLEFPNALEAVESAVELQRRIQDRNRRADPPQLRVRIGIHLGDIERRGSDILGDAVNVASRLEGLSTVGGICLSEPVALQVRSRLHHPLEPLPAQHLAGVREVIPLYRLRLPGELREGVARVEPRARIAVLPFANLSPDPEDGFFADGMTEELIGRIGATGKVRVIARSSTMHYKGSGKKVGEIARELGVDRVVDGSVRRAGDRLRVAVEIIDAPTEEQLWSSQFDRRLDDILGIQSEIAAKVAGSIAGDGGAALPARNVGAYTLYLRGNQLLRAGDDRSARDALVLFDQALREDPMFAGAHVGRARAWVSLATTGAESWERLEDSALPAVRRAIELEPELAGAHAALSGILSSLDRFPAAIAESELALRLDPSSAEAHLSLGFGLAALGSIEGSYEPLKRAHELDPIDPLTAVSLANIGRLLGRDAEASDLMSRVLELYPAIPDVVRAVALDRFDSGRPELARRTLDRALKAAPEDPVLQSGIAVLEARAGQADRAEARLRALSPSWSAARAGAAELQVALALAQLDRAFSLLERLRGMHAWPWLIRSAPEFRPLWNDRRFREFCRSVGILPQAGTRAAASPRPRRPQPRARRPAARPASSRGRTGGRGKPAHAGRGGS